MNNYDLLRPLLLAAGEPAIAAAIERYEDAVAAASKSGGGYRPPGERRKEAQRALDAEHLAATLEGRAPTLDASTLTAADEADTEHGARIAAAGRVVAIRTAELDQVVAGCGVALLHTIAVRRAEALAADPELRIVPADLAALFPQFIHPACAYHPVYIDSSTRMQAWWPLELGGWDRLAYQQRPSERSSWNEWAWEQLAKRKRKGFTVRDDGALLFVDTWSMPNFQPVRKGMVVRSYGPNVHVAGDRGDTYESGTIAMYGTGPNGEQGITRDDLFHLEPVIWAGG